MQLGIVKGQVVSTKKAHRLDGIKILIVQPLDVLTFEESGRAVASLDTVGAGAGEVVMLVNGSSARMTDTMSDKPTDSTIVAIIDSVDIENGRVFDKALGRMKREEKPAAEVKPPAQDTAGLPRQKTVQKPPNQYKSSNATKRKA